MLVLDTGKQVNHPDNGAVNKTGQETETDNASFFAWGVCSRGNGHHIVDTDHIAQCAASELQGNDSRGGQAEHFCGLILQRAK